MEHCSKGWDMRADEGCGGAPALARLRGGWDGLGRVCQAVILSASLVAVAGIALATAADAASSCRLAADRVVAVAAT